MDRRSFLKKSVGAATLAAYSTSNAVAAPATISAAGEQSTPNILYMIPHDIGRDLACYGVPGLRTPNLDSLAAGGVRFTNHFCQSACCSPARGTLMTGRYAHCNGLMGLVNLGWSLPESEQTIVDYLNQADYETCHVGLQHERTKREMNRYQRYLGKNGGESRYAEVACGHAVDFLKQRRAEEGPFYLNAGFLECHGSQWREREQYRDRFRPEDVHVPPHVNDVPGIRAALALYYGAIEYMDECVGRVLDTLEETGLAENTIVVFTTDHGRGLPRAKGSLYDPGVTTSMLMRWPGHIRAGSTCDDLAHSVDLVPTLLDMIGQPIPDAVQGKSFRPRLNGEAAAPHEQLFLERNYHVALDIVRAVRTPRFKYIRNFTERDRYMIPSENPTEYRWNEIRNSGIPRTEEELYDLESDPNEFTNLAADTAYEKTLVDLRGRLSVWMDETNDPMRGAARMVHTPSFDDGV